MSAAVSSLLPLLLAVPASWFLTGAVRRLALKKNIIDIPNQRSSHSRSTPRGGGLGLVLVFSFGTLYLWLTGQMSDHLFYALAGGWPVALVGWLDDLKPVPARMRILVHFASALWLLGWLPPPEGLEVGARILNWEPLAWPVCILGVVWLINSYNFMDGIDGLAAGEAVTVSSGGALLLALSGPPELGLPPALLAAAAFGFLLWNWPPAKIFMGDVSSGFLGYVMGVFWLASARSLPAALWWWPFLLGVFLVDATLTLFWRIKRKQKLSQAHRSHSYQYASRKYGHRRVTVAVLLINVLWLWPLAYIAAERPAWAWAVTLGGLLPLLLAWKIVRTGAPD